MALGTELLRAANHRHLSVALPRLLRVPRARVPLRLVSLVLLIASWAALARLAPVSVLPGPLVTARVLWGDLLAGTIFIHLAASLARVAVSATLALVLGTTIGVAIGLSPWLDALLDPWLVLALSVPRLIIIVVAYVWLGLNEEAAVTAVVLSTLPLVVYTIREGIRSRDRQLAELAAVFRVPATRRLRQLLLPELLPSLLAATRTTLGVAWKMVIFVELIGRGNGVGYQVSYYYQLYDMPQLLAYAVLVTAVMLGIEYALRRLDARLFAWRQTSSLGEAALEA